MVERRSHVSESKRQIAQVYAAGETLHGHAELPDCPDKFLGVGKICTKLGSRSGTSPIVSSASPIRRLFRPCQSSSSAAADPLDTSACLGFSPFYRIF
jgi:hypothetical protein